MIKEQIIRKGWQIDLSRIEEGYLYSPIICDAVSRTKAKSALLREAKINHYDLELSYTGKEVTYLNIPIIRCEEADIILYDGQEVSRYKAEELQRLKEHREKHQAILDDESITHCYIMKRGLYYGDDYCGYTEFKLKAGIYLKKDAIRECINLLELRAIPINVSEHNDYMSKHIEDLTNRLIR